MRKTIGVHRSHVPSNKDIFKINVGRPPSPDNESNRYDKAIAPKRDVIPKAPKPAFPPLHNSNPCNSLEINTDAKVGDYSHPWP